jgi:D-serine deaminase-like pyridoxal phosphate-dependent protein
MIEEKDWYLLENVSSLESPGLIFYQDRIRENIHALIGAISDVERLRPHVKTHKSAEVTRMMLLAGIRKFKCATIAEAEMLGLCEAPDVLLAYQPVGPNIERLFALRKQYPGTEFSCLVDNVESANALSAIWLAQEAGQEQAKLLKVYIDINVGMNRTGIDPGKVIDLYSAVFSLPGLKLEGLHAYDGHIHESSFESRKQQANAIITILQRLKSKIEELFQQQPAVIAGGSPTFPIFSQVPEFECSAGTFALWDKGYQEAFLEQPFQPAAIVLSRVVSLPTANLICTDLGHKAVASEGLLEDRVVFLNAPQLKIISQSEEHLVLDAGADHHFKIGDLLYGLPNHICPTVAVYEQAYCVSASREGEIWPISSRKRKINI